MKYEKQPLTLEQQADQLIARGLIADRQLLISRLRAVNYYRLTGYLYPFRIRDAAGNLTEQYARGTDLDTVWRRYNFDRRLRILLLDAIERIEVAVRTKFVYHFVHAHGPFGYLDARNLPGFKHEGDNRDERMIDHAGWLRTLRVEKNRACAKRGGEAFVKHFVNKYGDSHDYLPLWIACEVMTAGSTLHFVNGVEPETLKKAAAEFGFPDEQLLSWTKAIFSLRNACAHHARIWNRAFGVNPSVPGKNKNPLWHIQPGFTQKRVGLMMTVCLFWLSKVSATTHWKQRIFGLFDEYQEIPLADMGLPPDWRNHPLWQQP